MTATLLIADRDLSDSEFRLLSALKSFAWGKSDCFPENRTLAVRCGWFTPNGEPAISKVRQVLRSLERKKKRIRRDVVKTGALHERKGIAIEWPDPILDPRSKSTQGGGSEFTHPGSEPTHPRSKSTQGGGSESGTELDSGSEPDSPKPDPPNMGVAAPSTSSTRSNVISMTDGGDDDPDTRAEMADFARRLESLTVPPRGSRGHTRTVNNLADFLCDKLLEEQEDSPKAARNKKPIYKWKRNYAKHLWRVVRGEKYAVEDLAIAFGATMRGLPRGLIREPGKHFFGVLYKRAEDRAYNEDVDPAWRAVAQMSLEEYKSMWLRNRAG